MGCDPRRVRSTCTPKNSSRERLQAAIMVQTGEACANVVVMGNPLCEDSPEMLLIERHHPIEALAPGRPNEAFAGGVRLIQTHVTIYTD